MNNPDDQNIDQLEEEASSDTEELQDEESDDSEVIEDEADSEELEDEAEVAIEDEPEEDVEDVVEEVVEDEIVADNVAEADTESVVAEARLAEEEEIEDPALAAMMAGVRTSDGESEEEDSNEESESDRVGDDGELPIAEIAVGTIALGAAAVAMDAQQQERDAKKKRQEEERIAKEKEREQKQLDREATQKAAAEAREQSSQARSDANRFRAPEGAMESAAPARPERPERPDRPAPSAFPRPPTAAGIAAPPPISGFGANEQGEAVPSNEEDASLPDASSVPVAVPISSRSVEPKPVAISGDMADREASRKAAIEAKKAESEAKRLAHQEMLDQKAAERKAANESRLGSRESSGASHTSDFADLRGPVGGDAGAAPPMNDKMAKMAALAAGAGSVAGQLTSKLAQAKAEQGSPVAPVAGAGAGAPAAPLPPGSNDYLDLIQHLDARAVFHSEYADVKQKYVSRLLVGTEVLQCTLVGLNAGLIDSVYRKLSKLSDLMSLIDWKYVALEPVIVISESGQKRDIRIDASSTITIGRDPSSTIPIQSSFVSRNHAQIANASKNPHLPPQWVLKDLGSTHGTTLNGSPVRESVRFSSDDKIELGRGFASTDYPSIQLISRAIPYGRDDLTRMVIDVDLVICVVEADREFEGQANLLKNLSDVQKVGGLLVVAVSGSGPIEDSMEANLDELRHASRVLKSTELTRYLAAIDSDDISPDSEWLPGVTEFIDGFRQRSHANIIEKRKQITREEVVNEIRSTGSRLEDSLSKKLEEAERNLQRVQDELSMAPRNLGSAEVLRDDTFKALKQTLDDDTNFFSDSLRPDSLSYYAERLGKQLLTRTEGSTRMVLNLVEPNNLQDPHRWMNSELSIYARRHFDQLVAQITGPSRDPHGIIGVYQNLRELLGGHEKLRTSDLFSDENYSRYTLIDLNNQMANALSTNFVEYEATSQAKIDNMIMFVINKMRFAVMFYMSMFSIIAVVLGMSRGKLNKAFSGSMGTFWYFIAVTALIIVAYFTVRSYRMNKKDVIEEEIEKLRDQLIKHYQAVAKKFVEDAKRVLSVHLSTIESKIKQDMSTLGSSRMTESVATRNNPVLDQAKKERDDTQALIYAIGQERTWAESAQSAYTPSPFVAVAPARPTRTPAR